MASFAERLIGDDFVWKAVTGVISGRRRSSGTQFINVNCPMCVLRGETPDRKMRCGIKNNHPGVGISCFNCGFKTRWEPGELIPKNMREFLKQCGMSEMDVQRLNHKALTYRSMLEKSPEAHHLLPEAFRPNFPNMALPHGARSIEDWAKDGCTDPDFLDAVTYLYSRGDAVATGTTFYWTPNKDHDFNRRIIVPCRYDGRIVGYSGRIIDADRKDRYHMKVPPNYLFNMDSLKRDRKYGIIVEGILDAVAIDGVGLLGARLNPQQAAWINSFGKTIILVPDRDKRGGDMIDVALQYGWHVAFPSAKDGRGFKNWWEPNVKDAAKATELYGRLWTTLSIVETATDNKLRINMLRKTYC